MSLDQRYLTHLRQLARSQEQYVCVYCKQPQPITGRAKFRSHLQSLHSDEAERSSKEPNFDLKSWQEDVESRSKTAGTSTVVQDQDEPRSVVAQSENTQAFQDMSLDPKAESRAESKRKKPAHRNIAPKSDQRPPEDPGGGHKRPRSAADEQVRSAKGQSKSNPRRAVPKDQHQIASSVLARAGTFQSNFGTDGHPTRQLFNPADASVAATAGQVTLPPRSPGPSSEARQQSPSVTATTSTQPTQSNQERGVLPMPTSLSPAKDRGIAMPIDARWPEMLLQPDSRPISQEQLAAEVKSIYAGLTMVESKCIHVDKTQAQAIRAGDTRISDDHWQALIALHRTLLHEHHDFFLASQHPSASPALRRLASKYSMPARMWKHGIHSFLELLRYRLPGSLEFMISFIYTAYQMMSLLYETVPAFKNTWIECLGDLGRYRMAIEDEDVRDRENWANVSRFWYTKAADRSPEIGRLYHHLAILARPNALLQLSLYARSLISVQIFNSARESVLTLFNPILGRSDNTSNHMSQIDLFFIKAHAILFTREHLEEFEQCHNGVIELLDQHIGRVTAKWREQGAWLILALLGALFDYGNNSPLRRSFDLGFHKLEQQVRVVSQANEQLALGTQQSQAGHKDTVMEDIKPETTVDKETQIAFDNALKFYSAISTLVLRRQGDKNVLPYVHILLAFMLSLTKIRPLDTQIESAYVVTSILATFPRRELCAFLNTLTRSGSADVRYEVDEFVRPEKESVPLPEDHLIRGQVWSQDYFPTDLFKSGGSDDEEKNIEHSSTVRMRVERVLNLAYRLARMNFGIRYDFMTRTFLYDEAPSVKEAAAASTSETSLRPLCTYEDLHMSGSQFREDDSTYESEEDSPENKLLKQIARGRSAQSTQTRHLVVPAETTETADDILKNGETYVVCDEQVMLYSQDVFQMLVQRKWKIVVPNKVFHELSTLSTTSSPNAKNAQKALEQVKVAYNKTDLRIMDAKGVDVTKKHFESGKPKDTSAEESTVPSTDDTQEDTFGVARCATELFSTSEANPNNKVRPAILLTDNRKTRLRAAASRVASLAPNVLKTFLEATASRRRSLSRSTHADTPDSKSPSPVFGEKPQTPADVQTSDTMGA